MRGKKSPMIMGLIGAMLLSTNAFAAVPSDFSDFPTDWSAPAMTHAVQNGLLNGSDGKILPKGLLTRAQMATMVNRAFASSAKASLTGFTDMVPGVWHYDEMAKSVQMGAFQGADGKLSPNDPITREQAFAVLARAFGLADGKASSLDKFSDGTQVSSWARGAVAALVEQGYVTGADGALNPQSYITRAEFAQVMDALVAAYADQDLKDQTVEGNLILRSNSTLENVTVKGDLILADGVSAASLKNVTVTGRLVVRGGTDGVKLTKSTAKGGIQLANPNGTPKLTVDGKAYAPNGTTNGGNTSGGSGGGSSGGNSSSGGSSSGGNSSTKTDLVVDEQTKLVNVDWGQYVAVRFTSGNNLSNCTLTVDGTVVNKACSNVTTDGSIVKWEATTWNPAKLVITKGSQSQTVTLSQTANPATPTVGQKADAYYFLTNGPVYVWDYHLTNYDESGAVRYSPKVTTFSLTNEERDAIKYYSPEAVLRENVENSGNLYGVKGEVELMFNYAKGTDAEKAWVDGIATTGAVQLVAANENNNSLNNNLDYTLNKAYPHGTDGSTVACITVPLGQRNFYSNGRYQLRVTSNGTSKLFPIHVVNKVVPTLSATSAHVTSSDSRVYFEFENMLYGITQPIYRVDLTDPKNDTKTLTKIDDWYLIGDTFVLYNDKEDTNLFPYSGNYTVTIYADGFQKFSKTFEVTGGEAPTIQRAALPYGVDTYSGSSLSGGSASSGSGSEGGSNTMNAYIVFDADLLANANIMTALNTGNEYASAIAERWNELSHVDVYAKGSNDVYTYVGYVNAVSDAHVNGENLTFAAYAKKDTAKKDLGRPYAVKQVLEDNLLGETTTFSETSNKAVPDIVLVKAMEKEDGTVEYVSISEVTEGEDAAFKCNDKAYLKALENGTVKSTSNYPAFVKDTDYTIDVENGLITIKHSKLTLGQNNITLTVEGYQTARLSFNYQKVLETVALSVPASTEAENPVVITCNAENHKDGVCDFFASLTSVELTYPDKTVKTLEPDGQYSVFEKIGYEISKDKLTLGKDLFKTAGEYSVTLKAGYSYETQTVKFAITPKAEVPDQGDLTPPTFAKVEYKKDFYEEYYRISFADNAEAYLKNVTSATVNGTTYNCGYSLNTNTFKVSNDASAVAMYLDFPVNDFIKDGTTTVVVKAKGYTDLRFTVNLKDGKPVTGGDSGTTDPVDPSEPDATAAPTVKGLEDVTDWGTQYYRVSFEGMDKDALKAYLTKIKLVTVGSTTYTQSSYSSTNAYKLFATNTTYDSYAYDCLDLTSNGFPTDAVTRVAIEAEGYATLTFDVKNGQLVTDNNAGGTETPDPGTGGDEDKKAAPTYTYKGKDGYYNAIRIEFGVDAETQSWLGKIGATSVKVNDSNVELASSSYDSNFASKFYIRKNENPSYVYIGTALLTQSRNTIEITVDGYKTLTITVDKDGNEVK